MNTTFQLFNFVDKTVEVDETNKQLLECFKKKEWDKEIKFWTKKTFNQMWQCIHFIGF